MNHLSFRAVSCEPANNLSFPFILLCSIDFLPGSPFPTSVFGSLFFRPETRRSTPQLWHTRRVGW